MLGGFSCCEIGNMLGNPLPQEAWLQKRLPEEGRRETSYYRLSEESNAHIAWFVATVNPLKSLQDAKAEVATRN
jgi:hypothetical protein